MNASIYDYGLWHAYQVQTGDIDPAYPVLAQICSQLGPEDGAWLVLRYVAYYHLGSALRSYAESPGAKLPHRLLALPTGTERRGNRDTSKFATHWAVLARMVAEYGGPRQFLTPVSEGTAGWRELITRISDVWGNGRWAAYKTAELAQKVLRMPIVAPDADHAYSSGPRKGLGLFYEIPPDNSPATVARLDALTERLALKIGERDIAQVETSLCDFYSACQGRYYIGKDIDEQFHHLRAVPSDFTPIAMMARAGAFPDAYLGEMHGWYGPDKDRQRVFRDTGEIVVRGSAEVSWTPARRA